MCPTAPAQQPPPPRPLSAPNCSHSTRSRSLPKSSISMARSPTTCQLSLRISWRIPCDNPTRRPLLPHQPPQFARTPDHLPVLPTPPLGLHALTLAPHGARMGPPTTASPPRQPTVSAQRRARKRRVDATIAEELSYIRATLGRLDQPAALPYGRHHRYTAHSAPDHFPRSSADYDSLLRIASSAGGPPPSLYGPPPAYAPDRSDGPRPHRRPPSRSPPRHSSRWADVGHGTGRTPRRPWTATLTASGVAFYLPGTEPPAFPVTSPIGQRLRLSAYARLVPPPRPAPPRHPPSRFRGTPRAE
jgi:hypothetical protein